MTLRKPLFGCSLLALTLLPCPAHGQILPPLRRSTNASIASAVRIVVREFRFTGNRVFSAAMLSQSVTNYLNRPVNSDDLEEARRAVTRFYVNRGYVNSGALLDDQPANRGIITFRIVEGTLNDIHIEGVRHLRTNYLRSRLAAEAGPPLNINALTERLLILKENPNVKAINAELRPGPTQGTSVLDVKVSERSPWRAALQLRNDRPPSVGSELLELLASHQNVTGHSDTFDFNYGIAQHGRDGVTALGADNFGVSYTAPVTVRDATLQLFYRRDNYAVLDAPFESLDITSESESFGVAFRQPLIKTIRREIAVGMTLDHRESTSFLLGEPFSFSPGAVNGRSTVNAVRLAAEWIESNQSQVIALRSTLNLGLDVFDTTTSKGTSRDGEFVSGLVQGQWVRRLFQSQHQLAFTGNFQWADDSLLSPEQFTIGGMNSVRGYRENQVVRDAGVVTSAELRLTVWSRASGDPTLQLIPFYDYGRGWNVRTTTPKPDDISSVGAGLAWTPNNHVSARIFWGHRLREVENPHDNLQDYGLHFRLTVSAF